jgi:D-glycero-alpha-D-manno-heptose-7-phosphate kinase
MYVRARAPLRVSFCGGGTDVSPYPENHGGVVLSTTIDRFVHGTLMPREDDLVRAYSFDMNTCWEHRLSDTVEIKGAMSLIKAVVRRLAPTRGFDLVMSSDAPPGSGLGSSGSMASMLVGLIGEYLGRTFSTYEVANLAYEVEQKEMGLLGGRQDQYAAVFGGWNLIEFTDRTIVNPLRLEGWILKELQSRLLLCYTKETRNSGKLIEQHVSHYREGRTETIEAMHELKSMTSRMKDELLVGNLRNFADLLKQSWQKKLEMNPGVSTSYVELLFEIAADQGAIAGKLLGAGGGGHILFYAPFHRRRAVMAALEDKGGRTSGLTFTPTGLEVWKVRVDRVQDIPDLGTLAASAQPG